MGLPAVQRQVATSAAPIETPAPVVADDPFALHLTAQRGVASGGEPLPHIDSIQRSFGPAHDLAGVTAHVGGAAAEASEAMGAQGFATGSHVAFRTAPDLRLAAHEAAHVVQQRGGVQLSGGVGADGDAYERHADAVADRVVAGQSAADLLGPAGGTGATALQFYREYPVRHQDDLRWPVGRPVRVSDDGNLAVAQNGGYGSHDLWALEPMIHEANHLLQTKGSQYRLAATTETLFGLSPTTDQPRVLTKVAPWHGPTGAFGEDMTMPDDCGVGAHELMGAVGDDGKKTETVAVFRRFTDLAGRMTANCEDVPMRMKRAILEPFLRAKNDEDVEGFLSFFVGTSKRNLLDLERVRALDQPLQKFRRAVSENDRIMRDELPLLLAEQQALDELDESSDGYALRHDAFKRSSKDLARRVEENRQALEEARPHYLTNLQAIDDLVVAAYQKLSPEERDTFERRTRINRYAMPEIGQAFAISTGGRKRNVQKPSGEIQTTYNVHWAGVVMKSGGDTVTMENSAEHKVVPRNKNWIFQLYGAPSDEQDKRGQTFHEQNRDVVGAHGEAPTTMTVRPK